MSEIPGTTPPTMPPRSPRRWPAVLFLLVMAICAVGATAFRVLVLESVSRPHALPLAGVLVDVAPGSNLRGIAGMLADAGVIDDPRLWALHARLSGQAGRLQAGEYYFENGVTGLSAMAMLASGRVFQRQLTLVEGWTVRQVLDYLKTLPRLTADLQAETPEALLKALGIVDYRSPEGLFFPDTYRYTAGTTTRELLRRAHQRLRTVLEQEWRKRAADLPYASPYEALVMASLVEKETGVPSERPRIAGVFVQRLRKGMRLETDPSVIYGLGSEYRGNLTRAHLRQATPWNTYMIPSLPPTPIALAGREAIRAALQPESHAYLFFVARGDGSHQFSTTYQEHQQAVRRYQIEQRASDYRSRPEATP